MWLYSTITLTVLYKDLKEEESEWVYNIKSRLQSAKIRINQ